MKKKFHLCHLFDKTHQKCWIVMKLYFIFTVCLVGTSFGNSLAQKQQVTLNLKNVSLYELFNQIK